MCFTPFPITANPSKNIWRMSDVDRSLSEHRLSMCVQNMKEIKNQLNAEITGKILEVIRSFPLERTVEHCGVSFTTTPFDFSAQCPRCGTRVKLRAFSALPEIEDIFDAVFEWMNQPGAGELAMRRRVALSDDEP